MADGDALIDGLRAPGQVTARGHFTLDAEKAREKMRMFQLADPHRYVLLVLQALVARGALKIGVDIDTDDLRIESDARPFAHDELVDLHNVLLGEAVPAPGLRELALGLNAALALNPRWLRLESATPEGGTRLIQRPGEPDRTEPVPAGEPGVRLHVKERFRPGLLARFFRVGSDVLREQVLLRTHCRHARVVIELGGQRLPLEPPAESVGRWYDVVVGERVMGRVGLSSEGGPGRIELVRHQIWMSAHELADEAGSGVRAVLDVSDLRTDVSMAEVVRDDAYEALVDAMQRVVDVAVCDALAAFERSRLPPWLAVQLAARIGDRGLVHPLSPVLDAWLRAPLWSRLDGQPLSTAMLLSRASVEYSEERPDEVPQEVAALVDGRHGAAARLRAIFGEATKDRSERVVTATKRMLAKRAFEARRHPPQLPDDRIYHTQVPVTLGSHRIGVLAFHTDDVERGWIRIVQDGCLLVERATELPIARVHAVVHGKLAANASYDDVLRDRAFGDAMHAVLVAYDVAVQTLARERAAELDERTSEDLCRHLAMIQTDDSAPAWLAALGVPQAQVDKVMRERGRPWKILVADFDARERNPLVTLPLFQDATGAPLSLADIAKSWRERGKIRVIAKGRPRLSATPEPIVRADEKRLKVLTAIFGAKEIERAGTEFDRWVARDRFFAEFAPRPMALPLPCALGPFTVEIAGRPALVGLAAPPHGQEPGRSAVVQVYVEGRPLATERPACTIGGVQVALEAELAWVSSKFDRLAGEVAAKGIAAAVATAVGELAARVGELEPTRRLRMVLELGQLVWPGPTWLHTWLALGRELGEPEAARCYGELRVLADRHTTEKLRTVLRGFLDESVTPMPERVALELENPLKQARTQGGEAIAALAHARQWAELGVLPTIGGDARSLAQLVAMVDAKQRIGYVTTPQPNATSELLLVDREQVDWLSAVLGTDALQNVEPQLRLRNQRVAFEQRPPRATLEPDLFEVLVAVPVDEAGITGTLALPRFPPGRGFGRVLVCHRRREVCAVDPLEGTPLVGVLDGTGFGETSAFIALTEPELTRVRTCCTNHRAALLVQLARRWDALAPLVPVAAAWARHLLAELLPHSRASHVALSSAGVAELATRPLFIDSLGQPFTLAELRAELDTHGDIAVVSEAGLRLDRRLLHVRDASELEHVEALFDAVLDCDERARARAEVERSMQSAPPLPGVPVDAFAVVELDDKELVGKLWLDPTVGDETEVCIGTGGRTMDRRRPTKTFPCGGAVTGLGVELAPESGRCKLSRQRMGYLRSRASLLYQQLLASVRDAMPPADDPRTRALAQLLLRLHALAQAGGSWPRDEQRRFYRDLRTLPLLPLPNGRAISLDVALRERPNALAHIGLWEEGDAAMDDGGEAEVPVDTAARLAAHIEAVADEPAAPESVPAAPTAAESMPALELLLPPRPPTPEEVLAQRVRDELRLIRERDASLFAELYLERVCVAPIGGSRIAWSHGGSAALDSLHPIVRRAVAEPDPLLVSLLASAAFTVLNVAYEELTDEQEARVLAHHAAYLRTAARSRG